MVAQAQDAAGNVSFFTAPLFVVVDRTLDAPTIGLAASSASFAFGSGEHTTNPRVTLEGAGEPGSVIEFQGFPYFAVVDGDGRFEMTIDVTPGVNAFTVLTSDTAGNSTTSAYELTFHDISAPTTTIALVNDSGRDNDDARTK